MVISTPLSGFLDHRHRLVFKVDVDRRLARRPSALAGKTESVTNCAVTFCGSEAVLESVSFTMTCVEWLTVADCRPGPLTWLE